MTSTVNTLMARLYDTVDKINAIVQRQEGAIPDTVQKVMKDHLINAIGSCEKVLGNPINESGEFLRSERTEVDYVKNVDLTTAIQSCEKVLEDSKKAAGEFLLKLCEEQPDIDDVQKIIEIFPEALLYENNDGEIPIQDATRNGNEGIRYIPLLAVEASIRMIGPERGGLLLPSSECSEYNILEWLVDSSHSEEDVVDVHDDICLQALKDLRCAGLLVDKDFIEFDLIRLASCHESSKRFDYLVEIYPKSLSMFTSDGSLPIHLDDYDSDIDVFEKLLRAGMEHYSESFGFLFKRNDEGERPIAQAIEDFGKEETLQVIQKIIPSTEDHPILHHVFRYTPHLSEDFVSRYPDAVHLKDAKGRHLLHVAVKSGVKLSTSLLMMIHANKACIEEKDPVTNLYPFMLAASSGRKKKDLTTIYKLLSFSPDIISKCLDNGTN